MYPADHVLGRPRNGLNHVSMNLGSFDRQGGPVRGTNYPVYSDELLDWYQSKNVASVRFLFTWEAVQSTLGGAVPAPDPGYADYWSDLTDVVTRLLARNIYVILGPWQFNADSKDTDVVYDSASFTAADFADFWGKFAAAVNGITGNDQRVAFDLINEPHTSDGGGIGISLADWFTCAQAAITGIRGSGATNTIFIPGMDFTAAASFTTNGSSTEWLNLTDPLKNIAVTVHNYLDSSDTTPTALSDACSAVVGWARSHGVKVNIGETAINAGPNGRTHHCSTFAKAQAQWTDWTRFCAANDDVLTGWAWWANSAADWWNEGDSCDSDGNHWGLTLDDGATQTIYMDLIESSLSLPILFIRDGGADTGSEPDVTTTRAWESPDVWVRQSADGVTIGEPIVGGSPSVVYVSVTNKGQASYNGNDVIGVYWAKAQSGLSWPAPWDGSVPKQGGPVATQQPIGSILPGQSIAAPIAWAATPNPADFGGDGHFCLLAFISKSTSKPFDGFVGPDLNQNVLNWSKVAWRNIHIVAAGQPNLGDIVVANHTSRPVATQIVLGVLDTAGRSVDVAAGQLTIKPRGAALDRLREHPLDQHLIKDLGQGVFQILSLSKGIPSLNVRAGDVLPFGLSYIPHQQSSGFAVRVTQFKMEGTARKVVGGQTFVAGEVAGFTKR